MKCGAQFRGRGARGEWSLVALTAWDPSVKHTVDARFRQ